MRVIQQLLQALMEAEALVSYANQIGPGLGRGGDRIRRLEGTDIPIDPQVVLDPVSRVFLDSGKVLQALPLAVAHELSNHGLAPHYCARTETADGLFWGKF